MPTKKTNLGNTEIPPIPQKTEEKSSTGSVGFFDDDVNANTENDADDDLPLQAPKLTKKDESKPRVKRPQTEAQKAATAKMKAALAAKNAQRKAEKEALEAEHKRAMEEKVLKKAISIKKKQIKQESALDVISDDETPIEEIIPLVKKRSAPAPAVRQTAPTYYAPPAPPAPVKPRIIFM
jgi:hypothetical protein